VNEHAGSGPNLMDDQTETKPPAAETRSPAQQPQATPPVRHGWPKASDTSQ
jgi:hypothetical protein